MAQAWRTIPSVGLGLALVTVLGLAWMRPPAEDEPEPSPEPTGPRAVVATIMAEPAPGFRSVELTGQLEPRYESTLSFPRPGHVEVVVDEGTRLVAGDVIAQLRPAYVEKDLAMSRAGQELAKIELEELQRELDHALALSRSGAAPARERERAETAVRAARARRRQASLRLEQQRQRLADSSIEAPQAVKVSEVLVEPGDFVFAGQPVVRVRGVDRWEVEVGVTESIATAVATGQASVTAVEFGEIMAEPTQVRLVDGAPPPKSQFRLIVGLEPQSGALAGLRARVVIRVPATGRVLLPPTAIVDPSGSAPFVYAIASGLVAKRSVQVRAWSGSLVVVDGELVPGEQVITAGHAKVVVGEPLPR